MKRFKKKGKLKEAMRYQPKKKEPKLLLVTGAAITNAVDENGDKLPALIIDCSHDGKDFGFVIPHNFAEQIAQGLLKKMDE